MRGGKKGGEEEERKRARTRGRNVRDGEEMMVKTAPKVEEEEEEEEEERSEGHDVGDEENNGCWHQSYLQYGERGRRGGEE